MLFKIDTLYGHIIEDTPQGPVYQDDGAPVDPENPRPCLGCKARLTPGSHDPCIANLPGTYQACCGHGLDRAPNSGRPNGYVGLTDGRTIEFSGLCGGARRQAASRGLLLRRTHVVGGAVRRPAPVRPGAHSAGPGASGA